MDATDKELLNLYRQGRVDALETLVEKYKPALFGFIVNMMEGRGDADDVFQEVWFKAVRKLDTYRHQNFRGWLVRIAHNVIIDRARRRKPDVSLDAEDDDGRSAVDTVPGGSADPAARIAAAELGMRIEAAVASLPDEQKEVFLMRVRLDLSFKEIARIQKVSINTALARMHYALGKLRPMLADDYVQTGR